MVKYILCNLHGIEGRALAYLVSDSPERQAVGVGKVGAPRAATAKGSAVRTHIASLCALSTGTRTQVALTSRAWACMIFLVSLCIFISSRV